MTTTESTADTVTNEMDTELPFSGSKLMRPSHLAVSGIAAEAPTAGSLLSGADLKDAVAKTIQYLGGYWRPISAVARMQEELGEVAERMHERDEEGLIDELADLVVITTCLANQYCVDLTARAKFTDHADQAPRSDVSVTDHDLLMLILMACGRLARIINAYDGDKPLKRNERRDSAGEEIRRIHDLLGRIASSRGIDLTERVLKTLAKSKSRDFGRFTTRFDPSSSQTVDRFSHLAATSPCIFAKQAKIWGAPTWDAERGLHWNIEHILPSFAHFGRAAAAEMLDGYVVEICDAQSNGDIERFTRTFRAALELLDLRNPTGEQCLRKDMLSPTWRFRLFGVSYFITTFAPFYGMGHPRHSPLAGSSFLFFQPEVSFDHHGIAAGNPKRSAIKQTIRENFTAHGSPYPDDLVRQPIEALKYIKPLDPRGKPVFWWYPRLDTDQSKRVPDGEESRA